MFGVFGTNSSGSAGIHTVPSSFDVSWDQSVTIAKMADDMGFELFMPLSRWRGFGGQTDYAGETYETLTYMAGIAAVTHRVLTIVTLHLPLVHPTLAAKAIATIDHISNGRGGINAVMGWYKADMAMFGLSPHAPEDRYVYGAEWLEIVQRLWSEDEPFDHDGRYFHLQGCIGKPKPIQARPPIISAAMSPAGVRFATQKADFTFASFQGYDKLRDHSRNLRTVAAEVGNPDVGLVCTALVICRDTEDEAKRFHRHLRDNADLVAARNLSIQSGVDVDGVPPEKQEEFLRDMAMSPGNITLVGTAEQIAEQISELRACGVDALFIGFHDYLGEMPQFGDRIMPLLEQMGVRLPVEAAPRV
nr:LLM class flavin-dependent oxidoreductase [Sphingomonas formosensis]